MKFNIVINNPLKDNIIENYADLFYLIKRSFEPISKRFQLVVNDNEIAYFVMHFGSYFPASVNNEKDLIKAAILCPHGVGTSLLLEKRLSQAMPEINFVKIGKNISSKELREIDLVFSTVFNKIDLPTYMIKPNMTLPELALLKRDVYYTYEITTESQTLVDSLYERIEPYTDRNNAQIIKSEMDSVVDEHLINSISQIENYDYSPLLTNQMVQIITSVENWEEAIKLASQPLLDFEYITEDYIHAMIESVKNFGPYIILSPKVAVPHAKPSNGGKKVGVSLLKLDNPINFGKDTDKEDNLINLLFVISISDNSSHFGVLKRINSLISDESIVEKIIKATTKMDILEIVSYYDQILNFE